jgi:heat-inducible transcriptional repressor
MTRELKEKDLRILMAVIDLYVREGVPVSSKRLKQAMGSPLSTATLRNVLARLEKEGLLTKPHTSAGRIPTDEGYRFFVDSLEPNQKYCSDFTTRFREAVGDEYEMDKIMASASRVLGDVSKNFAVVYGSVMQESRVRAVKLIELEGSRILIVLKLFPEYERTSVIRTERRFDPEVLARAEALINPIIMDKSLDDAKEALDHAVRDNITDEGIIMREVAVNRETIFSEPPAVELYFEDREHILQQPELSNPSLLRMLLRLLHDKQYLTSILAKRLEEKTTVTIGAENEDEALKPFSLVTSGYRMGGARGVLGILGPTRMRYDLAFFLVGSIARELSAIGEEYF